VRVVLVLILILLACAALTAIYVRMQSIKQRKLEPPALAPSGQELRRLSLDLARHLERGLSDPLLRQSSGWEERGRDLLREYYGD